MKKVQYSKSPNNVIRVKNVYESTKTGREPKRMKWVIFQNILIVVVLPQQYNKVLNKRGTRRQWL